MTTKKAGGRITGLLALTCEASVALQVGDFVHLSGDYEVALADGTKPVLGTVSVRNVKRTSTPTSTDFPVGNPGGDVTVEARGVMVVTRVAGGAIPAGSRVKVDGTSALVAAAAGDAAQVGIALTATTGAAQEFDLLVTAAGQ